MDQKNDHDVLTADQMSAEAGCSTRVILESLRSDDPNSLKGRNLHGRKGWVSTRRALSEWIENGNAAEMIAAGETSAV